MISIDVGVNEGIFSRWMAKHSKYVEGFECNPNLHKKLESQLPSRVKLNTCALSSVAGHATLRFDPENTGIGTVEDRNLLTQNPGIQNIESRNVLKRTLDSFDFNDVSFMKIDVEGHELEVLKGAENLISRCLPVMLVEIEERHCPGNLRAVPAWLGRFGYSVFILNVNGRDLSKVDDLDRAALTGINNFWFLPESLSVAN